MQQYSLLSSLAVKALRPTFASTALLRTTAHVALHARMASPGIIMRAPLATMARPSDVISTRANSVFYTLRPFSSTASTSGGLHGNRNHDDEDQRKSSSKYAWIDDEAHELIVKAYARHKALADKSKSFPPSLSVVDLERIGQPYHYKPRDFVDRMALSLMKVLRVFVHAFFREKYDHHAVCLETVAAVPGLVASFHRHLRSLRRMKRDHGWITLLQEEAENERMHLLIFMQVCQPTALERALVVAAQGMYLTFYSVLYMTNSRAAHRLTGYLEEEAHRAYTDYLASIDSGKIANKAAPLIARKYYQLADDATIRDVVLHVRADESMHRDFNHHLGNKYAKGDTDSAPEFTKHDGQDTSRI